MSVPLIIEGTPAEVRDKLILIRDIIDNRKVDGWPLFQAGEVWHYIIRPDLGEVCPVCGSYAGATFDGAQIPIIFPYKELWTKMPYVVLPRTHMPDLSQFAGEPCHCELHLQNPAEAMEKRLHEEKLTVV